MKFEQANINNNEGKTDKDLDQEIIALRKKLGIQRGQELEGSLSGTMQSQEIANMMKNTSKRITENERMEANIESQEE